MAMACNAIKTRDFYRTVIAPRLNDDGVNAITDEYEATIMSGIPDPVSEGKQYTIRDLENDIAKIPGGGIAIKRK